MSEKNKISLNHRLCQIFILIVIGLSISGCATLGRISLSDKQVLKQAIKLEGASYLPLSIVCAQYRLSWEWDGFSSIISVKNFDYKLRLYIDNSLISYNGQIYDLKNPVRIHNGTIFVPLSFSQLFYRQVSLAKKEDKYEKGFTFKKIVIDPGHGGKDPGAIGWGEVMEKDVVFDISRRLKDILAKHDIEAILTRQRDVFIPLKERAQVANKAKADFFISIHANAAQAAKATGFEAYYLSATHDDLAKAVQIRENASVQFEENNDYKYSNDLNATLWDMIFTENRIESIEMAYVVADELKRILKLKTRYIKGAMFYVLKDAHVPAVLLEVGYLTNRTECSRLANAYYRQMLAETIAAGVLAYKKRFERTNGFRR
ncbi:MAG: N-acetylmuramoyl-L-alanine amidase [Candidatus Omnitrophica bacterium]|nr:N-acetylmuramoyl-L-alanine amidase [Candidatus Omnitrophota bacterium]